MPFAQVTNSVKMKFVEVEVVRHNEQKLEGI